MPKNNPLEHWAILAQIHCISLMLTIAVAYTGYVFFQTRQGWYGTCEWRYGTAEIPCEVTVTVGEFDGWLSTYCTPKIHNSQLLTVVCPKNTLKYNEELPRLYSLECLGQMLLQWPRKDPAEWAWWHLTSHLSGCGSMGFPHDTAHVGTQMINNNLTIIWLPFDMMFKISIVFQGSDCVILMQTICLLKYPKEYRTGFTNSSSSD